MKNLSMFMKYKGVIMKLFCWLLILLSGSLQAYELKSAQSKQLATQLVELVNQKIAEITALEIASGVPVDEIELDIVQQMRFDSGRFGAVLSANQLGQILSVTPRGQAAALGLQGGDIILSINDTKLADAGEDWSMLLQYLPNDSSVTLEVDRQGKKIKLQGKIKAKYIPQWQLLSSDHLSFLDTNRYKQIPYWQNDVDQPIFSSENSWGVPQLNDTTSCGQVILVNSLSISPPRFSGLKDTAVIKEVNGDLWGNKSRQRLKVGNHHLKIGSKYDTPQEIKNLSINVEANTNYYIAYVRNKAWVDKKGHDINIGKYTGPVIWKTKTQSCVM